MNDELLKVLIIAKEIISLKIEKIDITNNELCN